MDDFSKKGFTGIFRVRVVEIKPDTGEVTFRFIDNPTQYLKKGESFTATFQPITDDEPRADN